MWSSFVASGLMILAACSSERVDFNAQIRPILNEKCVSCHGGVKQSGGFGLVFRENAIRETESGRMGIVPGHPGRSALYQRIIEDEEELRMPLHEDPLSEKEIDLIKRWIRQGAEWQEHWAYIKPRRQIPPADTSSWAVNEIDQFILAEILKRDLSPSPQADPLTLLRRVYLDLTGLPPTPEDIVCFMGSDSTLAYEKAVDTLLASTAFGEHWASFWLDLARYADSFGYSSDVDRVIWKYRDWVINALNEDMPFDQFTIEQLAGDLLPNPSANQLIATAFHRSCLTNGEGGANHEENRNMAVIDRVSTTWETWQSTTMACVQCHNHPYDPIKQTDFYRSFAFFNNTNDHNLREDYPLLRSFSVEDTEELEKLKVWIQNYGSEGKATEMERMLLTHEPKVLPIDFKGSTDTKFYNRIGDDFMSAFDSSTIWIGTFDLSGKDRVLLNHVKRRVEAGTIFLRWDGPEGDVIGSAELFATKGLEIVSIPIASEQKQGDLYATFASLDDSFEIFIEGFIFCPELPGEHREDFVEMQDLLDSLILAEPEVTTPIMIEKPDGLRRKTFVFDRGNWLTKGVEVEPGIASALADTTMVFQTRLVLAKWLVSEENPLTARVMVNRIWANLFGRGIVSTPEDFGSVGELPSHPELLDWLALDFSIDKGWSVKSLIKEIVMSATYRQASILTSEQLEKDPNNLWLSSSPRIRLSAEQVRDQVLLVAGLLSRKMFGPGVMPEQPEGVWQVAFSNAEWITSEGEDKYRRGIYTYLKRSAPYPSLVTFDASGREVCLSRRIPTNTPLQALVTLNDPVFFEAARAFAENLIKLDGSDTLRISAAFNQAFGRSALDQELVRLCELVEVTKKHYQENEQEAIDMIEVPNAELAAYTMLANSLMNMDEFITRN